MTWIIGATTIFGYGALISDVEVTFRNGKQANLVQKAFPITNHIACGFAGSVKIGFALIEELANATRVQRPLRSNEAWDPIWVANRFTSTASAVFSKFPESERKLGAHLLMVGASPSEQTELGARILLIRIVSPYFLPGVMGDVIKVCSIGSGSKSRELKRRVKPLMRTSSGILQAEMGHPGGWGQMFSFSVTRMLHDNPLPGVSPHHHLICVRRGEITSGKNDEIVHDQSGVATEFRMPRVAANYSEFCELCVESGYSAAAASC